MLLYKMHIKPMAIITTIIRKWSYNVYFRTADFLWVLHNESTRRYKVDSAVSGKCKGAILW